MTLGKAFNCMTLSLQSTHIVMICVEKKNNKQITTSIHKDVIRELYWNVQLLYKKRRGTKIVFKHIFEVRFKITKGLSNILTELQNKNRFKKKNSTIVELVFSKVSSKALNHN